MNTPPHLPPGVGNDSVTIIGRQAILDAQRAVYAYELFDRSTAASAHTAASDAALLFNALSYTGTEALVGKHTVFVNCTHESLRGAHLELIHPTRIVLEVPALRAGATPAEIESAAQLLASLRERGFRLAFDQNILRSHYSSWLPLAHFIKLDMLHLRDAQLAQAMVRFASTHTQAQLVAEKIETQQQFELMRDLGVKLFQGYWFAKPDVVHAKTVRPSQANIVRLLELVRRQADVADIEVLLKKDPTLSFNLLRFINSSGFGLSCEITSFRHAVMILGLNKLFRWAALLLATSRDAGSVPAIGQTAVLRGRLMELLAAELLPAEEHDNAFIVGVFSLLDTMLGMSMADALDSIPLPQSVLDALLHRTGLFAPLLELTLACEYSDDAAFARASEALQLSNHQVNWAHLNALAWAEALFDEAVTY